MTSVQTLANALTTYVILPIWSLLIGAGLVIFLWGIVEFLIGLNGYNDKKEDGKRHMFWGLVGMFVMVAAYAFVVLIGNTVCTGGFSNCYK